MEGKNMLKKMPINFIDSLSLSLCPILCRLNVSFPGMRIYIVDCVGHHIFYKIVRALLYQYTKKIQVTLGVFHNGMHGPPQLMLRACWRV